MSPCTAAWSILSAPCFRWRHRLRSSPLHALRSHPARNGCLFLPPLSCLPVLRLPALRSFHLYGSQFPSHGRTLRSPHPGSSTPPDTWYWYSPQSLLCRSRLPLLRFRSCLPPYCRRSIFRSGIPYLLLPSLWWLFRSSPRSGSSLLLPVRWVLPCMSLCTAAWSIPSIPSFHLLLQFYSTPHFCPHLKHNFLSPTL